MSQVLVRTASVADTGQPSAANSLDNVVPTANALNRIVTPSARPCRRMPDSADSATIPRNVQNCSGGISGSAFFVSSDACDPGGEAGLTAWSLACSRDGIERKEGRSDPLK